MGDLIREQRHFLRLFVQTTPVQRKALLQTVTREQIKAFSQIAHNIIKGNVPIHQKEKRQLAKQRRLLHLLGDIKLGFTHKKTLVRSKERILRLLVNLALTYLETVLR